MARYVNNFSTGDVVQFTRPARTDKDGYHPPWAWTAKITGGYGRGFYKIENVEKPTEEFVAHFSQLIKLSPRDIVKKRLKKRA